MTSPVDSRDAFAALMARLAREGEDPGRAYERLRVRLQALFRVYLPSEADALADVALDRLAKRVADGVSIDDVRSYALGIARLVVREAQQRIARERLAEHDPTLRPDPSEQGTDEDSGEDLERVLRGLSACLDELDVAARALILAYYGADGAARIRMRRRLAETHGSTLNALRNRALRLRERIEQCVRARLGWSAAP